MAVPLIRIRPAGTGPSPRIACSSVDLPMPLGPVSTVTSPGVTVIAGASTSMVTASPVTGTRPVPDAGAVSMRSNAACTAVFPSWAEWNAAPTRRNGQNTSGASSSAVRPAVNVISPYTSRIPTLTATSATPRVASTSSTSADRKAMRMVAMAERRCATFSSAMRAVDPAARPSARRVGSPATRSSSRDCSVDIAVSAAAERSAVASPISTMKIGMSGSATSTMSADCQSKTAITAAVTGVRIAATNSAGR